MAKDYGLLYNCIGNAKFHTCTLKAQFRQPNDFQMKILILHWNFFFKVFTS